MDSQRLSPPTHSPLAQVLRWALVFALGVLLISMATGQSGITNYIELKQNRDALEEVVRSLAVENQTLEARIQKLKVSREAQLHYIKGEFGYVEKDEFVYHFSAENMRNKGRKQAADTTQPRRRPRI